jgi:hypothetical protein
MNGDTNEIVLHIARVVRHGTTYVVATPMAIREGDDGTPTNLSFDSWRESKGRDFADMELHAYLSESDGKHFVRNPEFRSVHCVDLHRAKSMVDALTKIRRAMLKADANEAGDMLMAFASAIGAKRCCHYPEGSAGAWLRDHDWTFEPIGRGRDMFRRLIRESEAAHPAAHKQSADA